MIHLPFALFSSLSAKIFSGLFFTAAVLALIQTVRIDGVRCGEPGQDGKRSCWIEGFSVRNGNLTAELDLLRQAIARERAAHQATKSAYRAAQDEAAGLEEARLARVAAQQKETTDAITRDYERRLAGLDARAAGLRDQLIASAARTGSSGAGPDQPVPGAGPATVRTDAAPANARLSATAALAGRSREEQLERDVIATRQALQLSALIDWVEAQVAIDPNLDQEEDEAR